MSKLSLRRHWIALACAAITTTQAQTASGIWRCGNSYSDKPCAEGTRIETDAPPSAERRLQSNEGTRRDMEAANRMQRERLRLEAEQAHRRAIVIGPPAHESARQTQTSTLLTPAKKKRLKKPDTFVASHENPDGKEEKKKKKKPKAQESD